jgi:23S rRNA (adenine2030-N6)-methyltransferase
MNYRHIYHAGNVGDVVKHAIITRLIERLRAKETAFAVVDTHAGAGLYDLADPRALKTGEAANGIERLLKAPPAPELAGYVRVVRDVNVAPAHRYYPGSPVLIRHLLRPQDRLIACELHPEDASNLKRLFHGDKQANVHHRNGYEALTALLPLKQKRGLVVIDPPFEDAGEFDHLTQALAACAHRWPQGCVMIWYPIKDRPAIWRFHEAIVSVNIPKVLNAEFIINEETRHDVLNGSGFIIANPPWQFDKDLETLFPVLHQALQTKHRDDSVKWLNE